MTDKEQESLPKGQEELKFDENPYDPSRKRPEDLVRLFYQHNVPIIPVVSKRGVLIGILKKEDVISELSDIARVEKLAIDGFITKIAARMPLDSLLAYGKVREFIVVNIFGEVQGRWSRLQLFTAAESGEREDAPQDVASQKEEQVLEWMIYLILEHIPRALYALNMKHRTIFYNSHFEELYRKRFGADVDTHAVEKAFRDARRNRLVKGDREGEHNFFSEDLNCYYEKVPMTSNQKKSGYLIFCLNDADQRRVSGIAAGEGGTLALMLESVERQAIENALERCASLKDTAGSLGMGVKQLQGRMKKLSINSKKK
ncbi:MAG: hypothetical protein JXA20_01165 [Spirochaetes bacterium]|nr:hypothetical protein [Spirochaetota bacterium]